VTRRVAAPPGAVWALLADLDAWPRWGPTVKGASLDGGGRILGRDARGRVRTAAGIALPFRVSAFEPGRRWAWRVAGVEATGHGVEPAPGGSLAWIDLPLWAAVYLPVCRLGLRRLARLAERSASGD
jgi:hypothetical protein